VIQNEKERFMKKTTPYLFRVFALMALMMLILLPFKGHSSDTTLNIPTHIYVPPGPSLPFKGHFYYFRSFPQEADGDCPVDAYDFYNQEEALPLIKKMLTYFACPHSNSWGDLEIGNYVDTQQPGYCVSEIQGKYVTCGNDPQAHPNAKPTDSANLIKDCFGMKCNFAWLPYGGGIFVCRVNFNATP